MEIVRYLPPQDEWYDRNEDYCVAECWPGALIYASRALESAGFIDKRAFPMLHSVGFGSSNYVDEHLFLDSGQADLLLSDLRKLRAVCFGDLSIPGLDKAIVRHHWMDGEDAESFELYLDHLDKLLQLAVTDRYWVWMML